MPYFLGMDTPRVFEWDDAKAAANLRKHGIPFHEAVVVFTDPRCAVLNVARAQDGEDRAKAIGSIAGRLFAVVFVIRGDVCRVISARRTNAKEDRAYG